MKARSRIKDTLEGVLAPRLREMTPEQFMRFSESHADEIRGVRFVPPSIGSKGFGTFEVETKTPYYEVCLS